MQETSMKRGRNTISIDNNMTIIIIAIAIILCVQVVEISASALPPPSSSAIKNGPFSTKKLQRFLHSKCQNPITKNAAIWSYEGRLVDPANGRVIANVEGIELVRSLTEMDKLGPTSNSKGGVWKLVRALRRLDDLKVRAILTAPESGEWDFAGTTLSRKLFCYSPVDAGIGTGGEDTDTDTDADDDLKATGKRGLMREFRLHPTAPVKKVKTEEAVALYDTATTFIAREDGKEMVIMTEWPDGHWVQSVATSLGDNGETSAGSDEAAMPFEFTVYAKRSGRGEDPALPVSELARRRENNGVATAPKRSKFIQFGKDNTVEDQRYGARETYSYMMNGRAMTRSQRMRSVLREAVSNISERIGFWDLDIQPSSSSAIGSAGGASDSSRSCTVRYTRYGEAPPWYGPGKMCTLELWGKRVESVADAPPLAATLAATRIPGFLSVHTPIPMGPPTLDSTKKRRRNAKTQEEKVVKEQMAADQAAIQAVSWFRGKEGVLPLEILKDDQDEEGLISSAINSGLTLAQRLRAATTAVSVSEGSSSSL